MTFPSPSRLDHLLSRFSGPHGLDVRVWAVDATASDTAHPPTLENELFGGPPRLVLLGAGEDGLVVVRPPQPEHEGSRGELVPWDRVRRVEREPHLVRDVLRIEVAGEEPLSVAVSNHVLLPANRTSAKALSDLIRRPHAALRSRREATGDHPLGVEPNPA
jgi:hypothetical protein